MDMPKMFAGMAIKQGTEQDSVETDRHDRVDEVIGETLIKAQYQAVAEYDFTDGPRSIKPGSKGSMLHFKHAEPSGDGVEAGQMLAAIAVRRLREGTDLKALVAARLAGEQRAPGCRLLDLRNLTDDRDILTIKFLGDTDGEHADEVSAIGDAARSSSLTSSIATTPCLTGAFQNACSPSRVNLPCHSRPSRQRTCENSKNTRDRIRPPSNSRVKLRPRHLGCSTGNQPGENCSTGNQPGENCSTMGLSRFSE